MITVAVNENDFRVKFQGMLSQVKRPRSLLAVVGREGANQLKKHFQQKDRTDVNRLAPGRRSHFWLGVSQMVQAPVVDDSANTVNIPINHPAIAQKVFGGTITAKEAGALTIPVAPEAYGRSAHTFEQETGLKLFIIRTGKGSFSNAVLAAKESNAAGFTIEYLLTPSVDQKADPTALPDMSAGSPFERALLARGENEVQRQLRSAELN